MARVIYAVILLASLYLPPSYPKLNDNGPTRAEHPVFNEAKLTSITDINILTEQLGNGNHTSELDNGYHSSTSISVLKHATTFQPHVNEKYLNQDETNVTSKTREKFDAIVKSRKDLDTQQSKIDKHTTKCTKKGNLTYIKEVMGYTERYIKKMNSSLYEVKDQLKLSLDKDEEIEYSSLNKSYEEKLKVMSRRLLALESLYKLVTCYNNFNKTWKHYETMFAKYSESKNNSITNEACIAAREMCSSVESQIDEMKILNKLLEFQNIKVYFTNPYTDRLRNMTYWKMRLEDCRKASENCEMKLNSAKYEDARIVLWKGVLPFILGIIFILGFLSNVLLLIIFVKEEEMRRGPNSMVLNLAVADLFNLIVNIPVFYLYFMSEMWDLGTHACILYRFMSQLGRLVSVYSVVAISMQKFLALRSYLFIHIKWSLLRKLNNQITIIVSVWLMACLFAVPEANKAGVYGKQCLTAARDDTYFHKWYSIYVLFCLCIVPGILITTTSVMSAIRIQESIRQIPGEGIGHDRRKRARQVSSNILIALGVVSLISYAPLTINTVVSSWAGKSSDMLVTYIVFLVAFILQFSNACFNPIALYIVSRKYKLYFKQYILCQKRDTSLDRTGTLSKNTRTTSA
ncbi:hypothetical protein C0J52_09004 [Blattella germanica]|nr:hypothetical protein C0J52_09004 [Blattella germanica]